MISEQLYLDHIFAVKIVKSSYFRTSITFNYHTLNNYVAKIFEKYLLCRELLFTVVPRFRTPDFGTKSISGHSKVEISSLRESIVRISKQSGY